MASWTMQTTVNGAADDVLAVLTDPEACTRAGIRDAAEGVDGRHTSGGCGPGSPTGVSPPGRRPGMTSPSKRSGRKPSKTNPQTSEPTMKTPP
jgi:hypothetical protein